MNFTDVTNFISQYWLWIAGAGLLWWNRGALASLLPARATASATTITTADGSLPANSATIVFDLSKPKHVQAFHVCTSMLDDDKVNATKVIELTPKAGA